MSNEIIAIEGLTKRYGSFTAVDHLTLSVKQGEVFGLLGPNGAGKTTTTLMLLGLTEPSEGSAMINGIDCTRNPLKVKRIVGYLSDNMGFYPDMTGRENLRMTGRMNEMDDVPLESRIDALLERVGMTDAADKKTSTYSKGMKQRLGIADILMKDPDVLIMDEPTNGIDPEGMRELMTLIRELSDVDGKTILISSHQLHQIQQICDRVGIFVKGKLIACGHIDELARQLEQESGFLFEISAKPFGNALLVLLQSIPGVLSAQVHEDKVLVHAQGNICPDILSALNSFNFELTHLRQCSGDLDEIYSRYFEKAGEASAERNQKPHLLARRA